MLEQFGFFLLKCLYFMLPAYFANMAPVIVKKINLFNFPLDFNKKLNNEPILGSHKTFRGFISGILFSVAIAYVQSLLYQKEFFMKLSFFDYHGWILLGILMGFGALAGDAVKSFFKRRAGIKPGHKFIPFDQIDFIFGALIFVIPLVDLTLRIFLTSLFLSATLVIIVNHIAFYMKIRSEKW